MYDEFLKNCPMEDAIMPSEKRVKESISAVFSLIEAEGKAKRKFKAKRILVTALISVVSIFLLLTAVNAATEGGVIKFIMGGKELEGDYNDYVDGKGFRHISFSAVLPIDENNFAVIYDVDKPWGENVRVITEETDPEFMERLRLYLIEHIHDPDTAPEDFGMVFKDNELCTYHWSFDLSSHWGGFGGNFLSEGNALNGPSGHSEEFEYDHENGTKNYRVKFIYYVGKE